MQGKRIYPEGDSFGLKPGEYGNYKGIWFARAPIGHLSDLSNHEVTEHEDKTISVSPSILVIGYDENQNETTVWHGFLERGTWREA